MELNISLSGNSRKPDMSSRLYRALENIDDSLIYMNNKASVRELEKFWKENDLPVNVLRDAIARVNKTYKPFSEALADLVDDLQGVEKELSLSSSMESVSAFRVALSEKHDFSLDAAEALARVVKTFDPKNKSVAKGKALVKKSGLSIQMLVKDFEDFDELQDFVEEANGNEDLSNKDKKGYAVLSGDLDSLWAYMVSHVYHTTLKK